MKAVKIPADTDSPVEVVDVGKAKGLDWLDLVHAIGGPCRYIEKVNCVLTPEHQLVMVVDEQGLLDQQPPNPRAQHLYPFSVIVGNVLVMHMDWTPMGIDFTDLADPDRALELVKEAIRGRH